MCIVHYTKISPEFECQGQRPRSLGTKKRKSTAFVWESSSGTRSSCFYAGGKISTCCGSFIIIIADFFQLVYKNVFLVHGQVTIIFVVSDGLSVCLFVCAEFFSAIFDLISIKLGHMLYVWV